VLLDRRLRHHQVGRDLSGRRGDGEGLVGQRRTAQRGQHVELAAGELGYGRTAQLGLGRDLLLLEPADAAPGRAETQYVTLIEDATRDRAPVNPGPVP
jgi:hypothetical protein